MKKVVVVKRKKIEDLISENINYFDLRIDNELMKYLHSLTGKNVNEYNTEGGRCYEFKLDNVNLDKLREISTLENQIVFELHGLWIVYDFSMNLMRITKINQYPGDPQI